MVRAAVSVGFYRGRRRFFGAFSNSENSENSCLWIPAGKRQVYVLTVVVGVARIGGSSEITAFGKVVDPFLAAGLHGRNYWGDVAFFVESPGTC